MFKTFDLEDESRCKLSIISVCPMFGFSIQFEVIYFKLYKYQGNHTSSDQRQTRLGNDVLPINAHAPPCAHRHSFLQRRLSAAHGVYAPQLGVDGNNSPLPGVNTQKAQAAPNAHFVQNLKTSKLETLGGHPRRIKPTKAQLLGLRLQLKYAEARNRKLQIEYARVKRISRDENNKKKQLTKQEIL
jgi:hypothetical protein